MPRVKALLILLPIFCLYSTVLATESLEKQRAELEQLRRILTPDKPFDEWLDRSGELPPDFDALPTTPYPPDIFTTSMGGTPHRVTIEEWPARRAEMRTLLEDWLIGHAPPHSQEVRAIIEAKTHEPDKEIWQVRLEFGPGHAAKLHCWLWMSPNLKTPAPVFLVDNFEYTRFAADALKKGTFAICVYNAGDPAYIKFMPPYVKDRHDESDDYKDLFGKYDWSEFRRRGWSASRAVDWLSTLDFIDAKRIYIGGHSRSAKQAMVSAAFDDRIAGVIASSPGSGGSLCYRYCDQYYYGESGDILIRGFPNWVSPKVRFFTGRENKLPADTHFEYALIAPRPVLMSTALQDTVENSWAVERTYDLAHPVWEFLGKPGNLVVRYRPGHHSPDDATYHAHSDFLEEAARGGTPEKLFPYQAVHVWSYPAWLRQNGDALRVDALAEHPVTAHATDAGGKSLSRAAWAARRETTRKEMNWLLGEGPAYSPIAPNFSAGESEADARLLARSHHEHASLSFGDGIHGDVYRPAHPPAGKLPAILWMAPLHASTGYAPEYRVGDIPYTRWIQEGFVVFAYDPIATGGRQEERRDFYDRNPRWSLMGKMVLDARHAIDAIAACPDVDASQVYLVGFGMGGMAATFTAGLDDRIAGVASIAGWTPFRTDTDASPTGGVRRWSELYGWLPRLGQFAGHEAKVPVDFDDILASIAPRPMLVIAPTLDWHANGQDVERAATWANDAYRVMDAKASILLLRPERPCQFDNDMQAAVAGWLRQSMAR